MPATREAIAVALESKLAATQGVATITRRNTDPEKIAQPGAPALVLVSDGEDYTVPAPGQPPKRTMHFLAIIYTDAGSGPQAQNTIPDSILNPILDGVDAALAADNPIAPGRCTLGGLVYSCRINGKVTKAPGDKTGKGLAIVPIEIVIP